jgi:hypothetical protein
VKTVNSLQFFRENTVDRFFAVAERTGTGGSLILPFSPKTGFDGYLIPKFARNKNLRLFKNSRNRTTLVPVPDV